MELNTRLQSRPFDLRVRLELSAKRSIALASSDFEGHCHPIFHSPQTPTNNAIFRIQGGVGRLFREYLDKHDFVEIHTPKLQGAATESGASVFKVDYFKREGWLPVVGNDVQSRTPSRPCLRHFQADDRLA